MVTIAPAASTARPSRSGLAGLARDSAFVLPGFFISLFAFILLVPLFAVSIGTLIIWIGVLLLPVTLYIASGFAALSRARLRQWGIALPEPRYRERRPGVQGFLRWIADPRRWLDLVFETLVAFPVRTFTFCVGFSWIVGALAGLTWMLWGFYIPGQRPLFPGEVLEALTGGAIPDSVSHAFWFEVVVYFVLGVVLLLTLPPVMRGLAWVDAAATSLGLGSQLTSSFDDDRVPTADEPADAPEPPVREARSRVELPSVPSAEAWAWIAAVFAAVATIAVGWPVLAAAYHVHLALAMAVVLLQAGALVLTVGQPVLAIALGTLAPAAAVVLVPSWVTGLAMPWSVPMMIAHVLLVLLVSLRHAWPWAVAAWLLPQLAVSTAHILLNEVPGEIGNIILSASISLGVAVIGVMTRSLLRSRGVLLDERRQRSKLSAERQALAERNRIAQELHDVVAHSMSVISVQATTAKYRLDGVDENAAEEFESIAASSRQALSEMRGLLATLRAADGEAPLVPQPEFGDIPELVEATRRSGALIDLAQEVDPAEVPPATGLTAYRIVQEALSNAVRHAPGASIDIAMRSQGGMLGIEVRNGPRAAGVEPTAAPGAGLGLAGIRDRVAALGGSVEAGPDGDGGFRLRAVLPL